MHRNLWTRLFSRPVVAKRDPGRPKPPAARPTLTTLEPRCTPAIATLVGGDLRIDYGATGTTSEAVTVSTDGTTLTLSGGVTGATTNPAAAVSSLTVVDSGGGTVQSLTLNGTAAFQLVNGLSVTGVETVAVNAAVNAGAGTAGVAISAGTFSLAADLIASPQPTGGIAITADAIDLAAGSLTAGAGVVSFAPAAAGRPIDLGGPGSASSLGLTDAELDRVTAGTLRVGGTAAGTITISAPISPANAATLELSTAAEIMNPPMFSAVAITVGSLSLSAAGGIGKPAIRWESGSTPVTTAVSRLEAASATGSVVITNNIPLAVGGVTGTLQGITAGGSVDIFVTGGLGLTVGEGIAAGTDVSLHADEIDLNGGAGSVRGNGTATLGANSRGEVTLLGGTVNTPGSLSLTETDFQALAFPSVLIGLTPNGSGDVLTVAPLAVQADLTIYAINLTLAHDVTVSASASARGNLSVSSLELRLASVAVTADGDMALNPSELVVLSGGGTTTLTSTRAGVDVFRQIAGTTPGAESLTVSAPATGSGGPTVGIVKLWVGVGRDNEVPIGDLTVTAGVAIELPAAEYVTGGRQTYNGAANLTDPGGTAFRSTAGGDLTFTGTISAPYQAGRLEFSTDGAATFAGIGPTVNPPLYGVVVSAAAGVTFTGDATVRDELVVNTSGPILQSPGTLITLIETVLSVGRVDLTAASVGTAAAPVTFAARTVVARTGGANGDQYLRAVGTTAVDTLDAGGGTVTLAGGTFMAVPTVGPGSRTLAGTIPSAVVVEAGATLGGTGPVGNVTATGGTVSPGTSPGILATGNATLLAGSTFTVQIDGTTPGTGYDQLAAAGTVELGGATLVVSGTLMPAAGTTFVIVANDGTDPVVGTFAGLPDGAEVDINGVTGRINYNAGDGNDVVLVAGPTATGTTVAASADPVSAGQPVTFTATVTGGIAGAPVSFTLDGATTPFATAALDADGRARVSSSAIPPGNHTITAAYAGNATTLPSSGQVPLTVVQAPALTGAPFPTTAALGTPFTFTITATGFPLPAFAVSAGQLPPGLTLDPATGTVAGTPTAAGSYAGEIRASNSAGSADLAFSIAVTQVPAFTDGTLPATAGLLVPLTVRLTAVGFPAPTFSVAEGALPPGLSLDAVTGTITGAPTQTGSYTGTIRATNSVGAADLAFSVSVIQAPAFTSGPLPATAGLLVPLTVSLTAAGFPAPTFVVAEGTLPPGLSLDPVTGTITGAPTQTGSYAGTIRATNAAGSAELAFAIAVTQVPAFTSGPLPATAGLLVPLTVSLTAVGFPAPTFSVAEGALPPGLSLDPVTGTITGAPTATGSYTGTIRATNSAGAADLPFAIAVTQVPAFTGGTLPSDLPLLAPFAFTIAATGFPVPTFAIAAGQLPPGLTLDPMSGGVTGVPTQAGQYTGVIRATNAAGSADLPFSILATSAAASQGRVSQFAVSGGPTVSLSGPDGTPTVSVMPFGPAVSTRAVVADATGDGVPDLVVGSGPGVAGQLVVIDGASGETLRTLFPFEASFTGGTFVAAGDVDGDGYADLAVAADAGGGPRVIVYSGRTGETLADLFGIDDALFRGGAHVVTGDLNGDGLADLVVAAGTGGGPRVAVFDGASLRPGRTPVRLIPDFFALDPSLRDGVFVAAGDVTGDGRLDLIAGGGPTGGPRVVVFDGPALMSGGGLVPVADFFAADTAEPAAAQVSVKDLDGDAFADVAVAVPTPAGNVVKAYAGRDLAAGRTVAFRDFGSPDDGAEIFVG